MLALILFVVGAAIGFVAGIMYAKSIQKVLSDKIDA